MSSHEQALAFLLSQIAFSFDGAILGLALAYAAVRSFLKFTTNSKAIHKIREAPTLRVSDIRSVLDHLQPSDESRNQNLNQGKTHKLVIVRGQVVVKSDVDGNWKSLRPNVLVAHESGDKAVIVQRTQAVPFVLVEGGRWPQSDYVIVNMDGSRHPLPLITVYHQLQPIVASPYTFLQALFAHEYPVGLLHEEKILPLGKEIYAVGICSSRNGVLEIKSCKDLPYFLSDMTKEQIVVDLAFKTKVLLWSGIFLGSVSIGILGYAVVRNWNRWKEWRQRRQSQQQDHGVISGDGVTIDADEETGEVPDGQLCVICLMRRKRSVFIPCGHLVCCQNCAISVERGVSPKCPLCRQAVRSSMRIYEC